MEGLVSYEHARIGMTVLAEIIVRAAFDLSQKSIASRYGEVKDAHGEPCNFAILGLGKLGGEEMTYHSDLDLIFIHSGEGATTGPSVTGAQEYWIKIITPLQRKKVSDLAYTRAILPLNNWVAYLSCSDHTIHIVDFYP